MALTGEIASGAMFKHFNYSINVSTLFVTSGEMYWYFSIGYLSNAFVALAINFHHILGTGEILGAYTSSFFCSLWLLSERSI